MVGVADVQQSTKAIRENRYKAVNMAGAAVIASVANVLKGRDFPFVLGGDGATFAVPAADTALARQALAETGQGRPLLADWNGFGRCHPRARS